MQQTLVERQQFFTRQCLAYLASLDCSRKRPVRISIFLCVQANRVAKRNFSLLADEDAGKIKTTAATTADEQTSQQAKCSLSLRGLK